MWYIETVNFQTRIQKYISRGFESSDAQILVLIEEAASGLFTAFPDRFILIGGANLVLFYDSPRLSRDLDLLATSDEAPSAGEVQRVIEASVQPLAEILGLGKLEFQQGPDKNFSKIWIRANQQTLFTVDLTRIGGTVLKSQVVQEMIAGETDKRVETPSAGYLLLQKCETFLDRQHVKSRDAFDIDILLARGARLDDNLRAHLHDFIKGQEFDSETIRERIEKVDARLCTAELRPILPEEAFTQLARDEFLRLRTALRTVFSDWL